MQCDIELNASQSPVRYSFSLFFFVKKTTRQNKTKKEVVVISSTTKTTRQQIQLFLFFLIFRPSYCGATKGQTETLRFLVQHQADLWLRSTKGDVSLHEAVACGRKDLVLWILRQCQQQYGENGTGSVAAGPAGIGGAHVVNNDGRSPLYIAAINNNVEVCKVRSILLGINLNRTASWKEIY